MDASKIFINGVIMSDIAHRLGWQRYAEQEMLAVYTMTSDAKAKSVDQLIGGAAADPKIPATELLSLVQYGPGMTEKELTLRAAFQGLFEKLSPDVLQADFTHFCKRKLTIEKLATVAPTEEYAKRANTVIIDELGKALIGKGGKPQVPKATA